MGAMLPEDDIFGFEELDLAFEVRLRDFGA
jgi:hypothetical protein